MAQWHFPLLGGGEAQGLNEPGVEMFKEADSLARETTQNVLDNPADESLPRRIDFEVVQMPREFFPGIDPFRDIVGACEASMRRIVRNGSANEDAFFRKATELLDPGAPTIPCLRIRDTNTTGLHGEDEEEDKPFCRLLKVQGVSSPQGASGGTYGIGQRAPFHCSALRTIVYCTRRHTDQSQAFIAKSILCTFQDPTPPHRKRQSKGWWCNPSPTDQDAWSSIRNEHDIPTYFRRSEPGTDLYITGFVLYDTGWEKVIRYSVLANFFAAIALGELVVGITDDRGCRTELSQGTLAAELNRAAEEQRRDDPDVFREGLARTLAYHKAFTAPVNGAPFTTRIEPIGDVRLYVDHDPSNPDLPDRWGYMRKPHMLVGSHSAFVIRRFAGLLICDNDAGNKYLAQLEGPQHREWKSSELRNVTAAQIKQAEKIDKSIREFVRESLRTLRPGAGSNSLNPVNLGNYLPLSDPGTGSGASSGPGANLTGRITPKPLVVRTRPVAKPPAVTVVRPPRVRPAVQTTAVGSLGSPAATSRGGNIAGAGGPGGGKGGAGPGKPRTAAAQTGLGVSGRIIKPDDVSFRSFYSGPDLCVVVTSRDGICGDLRLAARGEGGTTYEPRISSVQDWATGSIIQTNGSTICNVSLQPGVPLRLRVTIDALSRICLGLEA